MDDLVSFFSMKHRLFVERTFSYSIWLLWAPQTSSKYSLNHWSLLNKGYLFKRWFSRWRHISFHRIIFGTEDIHCWERAEKLEPNSSNIAVGTTQLCILALSLRNNKLLYASQLVDLSFWRQTHFYFLLHRLIRKILFLMLLGLRCIAVDPRSADVYETPRKPLRVAVE